jgi:NAD(P)-dependent dehydrogenase (short-subunit alcohol dehydrogenase family)
MRDGQIIVTGASKGIGAGIAEELVRRGYEVAAISRSGTTEFGYGVTCDVMDERALADAIARIGERGPIIGLVNNAGAHEAKPTLSLSADDFERTIRLNTTAVLIASREVHPHLVAAGGGMIINIGSFFERLGVVDNLAYCASKAAVGAMTRCLAAEWSKDNIRVLDVAPGYIETDLNRDYLSSEKVRHWLARRIPVGRPGRVDEVSRLVATLFVENIAFLTGETIYIDGGQGHNH